MNKAGSFVAVGSGLLDDPKHRKNIGPALWEYLHLLKLQRNRPDGLCKDGAPVSVDEIAAKGGVTDRAVRKHLDRLESSGYIAIERTAKGPIVTVQNAKSWGKTRNKRSGTNVPEQTFRDHGTNVPQRGTNVPQDSLYPNKEDKNKKEEEEPPIPPKPKVVVLDSPEDLFAVEKALRAVEDAYPKHASLRAFEAAKREFVEHHGGAALEVAGEVLARAKRVASSIPEGNHERAYLPRFTEFLLGEWRTWTDAHIRSVVAKNDGPKEDPRAYSNASKAGPEWGYGRGA